MSVLMDSDLMAVSPSSLVPEEPCCVAHCGRPASTVLTMPLGSARTPVRLCEAHCRAWAAASVS